MNNLKFLAYFFPFQGEGRRMYRIVFLGILVFTLGIKMITLEVSQAKAPRTSNEEKIKVEQKLSSAMVKKIPEKSKL